MSFQKDTSDCGKKYGCSRFPPGCQNVVCEFLVKWLPAEDDVQFVLHTNTLLYSTTNSWLAIGFSNAKIMVILII